MTNHAGRISLTAAELGALIYALAEVANGDPDALDIDAIESVELKARRALRKVRAAQVAAAAESIPEPAPRTPTRVKLT